MSLEETFDGSLGNYVASASAPATAAFDGSLGNPAAGCAKFYSETTYTSTLTNNTDTHLVGAGEGLYFNLRFISNTLYVSDFTSKIFGIFIEFSDAGDLSYLAMGNSYFDAGDPLDTGWFQFTFPLSTREGKTINNIHFIAYGDRPDMTLTAYLDSIAFATSPPAFDPDAGVASDELRYIGLAADQVNLYASVNDSGTLKLFVYSLETLAQLTEVSFGAATFAELDDRTRGIFPVVKPGADGVVFLRGRDGSNVAVQRSDDSGAIFAAKDDGGWTTTKYAVALLINPLDPDDLVAAFDDDDLYQSLDAGETWTKLADAPGTLRAAGRHLVNPDHLLLAEQAADTIHFSPNLGLSSQDVSDAALDTINVIEVSR